MSYHGGEAQARAKLRFLADTDSFEEFPDVKVGAAGCREPVHRSTTSSEWVAWHPGAATGAQGVVLWHARQGLHCWQGTQLPTKITRGAP